MQSVLKQVGETKTFGVDFTPVLGSGESITLGNVTVTVTEIISGTVKTGTMLLGSVGLSGNIVTFQIQAGSDSTVYRITVNTGATNSGNKHEEDIVMAVSDNLDLLYSVDELKNMLNISDTSKDVILFTLIREATEWIENATQRIFQYKTYTETKYLEDTSFCLFVSQFPLLSVSSLTIDGDSLDAFDAGGDANYVIEEEGVIRRLDGVLFPKNLPIIVSYKAGFAMIPEDIRMATKKIVISEYGRRLKEGLLAETIGNFRIVWNKDSIAQDPLVNDVIQRYKKRFF